MFFLIALIIGAMSINVSAAQQTGNSVQNTEKVTPATDKNPIVGELTLKNGQKLQIRKGPKGGYYAWRIRTRGPQQGQPYKYYPTKEERKLIRFYK